MTFLTEFFEEFRNICISHRFIIIDFLMHLKRNGTLNVYYRCKLWIKLNEKNSKPGSHFLPFFYRFHYNYHTVIVFVCGPHCRKIVTP